MFKNPEVRPRPVVTSGGSAWVCQGSGSCGIVRIGGQDLGAEPFLKPETPEAPEGYDGIYYIGLVEASPPFVESSPVKDD